MSNNIKALREQHDMTQRELADRVGVAYASIYKWEHGINNPRMNTARKLASVFGCTLDQLMGRAALGQDAT